MAADATERLVNLALFFASGKEPVSAAQVRSSVEGYPGGQDEAAFLRMFERDKDDLRNSGFVVVADADGRYSLDAASTFAAAITLSPEETAVVRAVGWALSEDPGFPFGQDLRFALSKVASALDSSADRPLSSNITDPGTSGQARLVALLDAAMTNRKRVSFGYTNSRGEHKTHEIEPYGLFLRDGRWYAVGRDVSLGEPRVYAVSRMESPNVNTGSPKSPDYERPADFDVSSFVGLPFQYGAEEFEATLRISAEEAWRLAELASGSGSTRETESGAVEWRVPVRNGERLMRWVVEHGPGVAIVEPQRLADELRRRLAEVEAQHA